MLTTTHPTTALRFAHETIEAHRRQADRDRTARVATTIRRATATAARWGARNVRPIGDRRPRPARPSRQAPAGGMFALMRNRLSGS